MAAPHPYFATRFWPDDYWVDGYLPGARPVAVEPESDAGYFPASYFPVGFLQPEFWFVLPESFPAAAQEYWPSGGGARRRRRRAGEVRQQTMEEAIDEVLEKIRRKGSDVRKKKRGAPIPATVRVRLSEEVNPVVLRHEMVTVVLSRERLPNMFRAQVRLTEEHIVKLSRESLRVAA